MKNQKDELDYNSQKDLVNNENVFLSTLVTKYNDFGYRQERTLVLTNQAIYNISKKKIKRRIPYKDLEAITVSTMSSEFLIHVKNSNDYRFLSFQKKNIIVEEIMRILCVEIQLCSAFPVYYVPMINLQSVMTTHSQNKKNKQVLPDKEYLKIMNLEKFLDEEKNEIERKTEMRKKTTMLFTQKNSPKKDLCIEDFYLLKVLGKGAFGKVILSQKKDTGKLYAIKILKKKDVIELDQLEHTKAEKKILQHVNHPFLVSLEYAFQTPAKLYFVMEFMAGGELFQHLRKQKRFNENQAKFYAACITLALGHLHNKNYIYRDLKLENLLLDKDGYAKLTDFGLAKFIEKDDKALTFCGTPEYLSPEVILGKGHNRPADWWSLGILIYEMLFGIPPFYCQNVQTMYRKAIREKVVFKSNVKISKEAKDIINKLLTKQQKSRLGSQADSLEVLSHPWFEDLDWSKILDKELPAPFKPKVEGDTFLDNFDEEFTREKAKDSIVKVDVQELQKIQKEFDNLNFDFNKSQFNFFNYQWKNEMFLNIKLFLLLNLAYKIKFLIFTVKEKP